jgi:hypothetical protein
MGYGLRVLESYPWPTGTPGTVRPIPDAASREDAETVRRALPNANHWEVVELGEPS